MNLTKLAFTVALAGASTFIDTAATAGNVDHGRDVLLRGTERSDAGSKSILGKPASALGVGATKKSSSKPDKEDRRTATTSSGSKNVFGDPLAPCSQSGMAKTGYDRSGQCVDQAGDTGSHHICIDLSSASSNGKDFCQVTGQDDWCKEDMPCHEDSDKQCPVKNWCVCQWAFEGYLDKAGGCDAIQEIDCEAVNVKAIEAYEEDEAKHGEALKCLRERCKLEKGGTVSVA